MNDCKRPRAEVGQDDFRVAGMRALAAGQYICGKLTTSDPQRTIVNVPEIALDLNAM
jgi:hypothetical protein